ncbi:carbohydrate porin [Methylobacterium sp. 88A]|uniref:carbohydrate porin n=1 Tax=Methylobacterium sp. 88A TaxID=1131813 RepID=UPI00037C6B04|nr:carbohydrate porin [Methylobacterium sp. 88A]
MMLRSFPLAAAAALLSGLAASGAHAQTAAEIAARQARLALEGLDIGSPRGAGGDPQTSVAQSVTSAKPSANLNTSIQDQLGPYGDPYGLRSFLKTKGIEYSLTYIGESFGNATGGARRGAIVEGRLDVQFDADLEKLAGWHGAAFHTNLYLIHGTGLSRYYVNNFITVSAIEALPSSRLYELWLEQKLFDGQFSLKVGQIAADTEFAVSQTGTLFINSTFGWPNIMAEVLPSGGPIYPLAVPAIRAKYVPNQNFSLQVGLFDGDPAGAYPSDLDPQRRNRTGTNFRTGDPALVIAEVAYAYNIAQGDVGDPGTVTLGGWHHFGRFDSQRFDTAGRSLADPSTTGIARRFRGDSGLYGIIDQTIYREPDDPNDGASVFLRVSGAPSDRNIVDFYADMGIAYKGLFKGRSDDTIGVAFAIARISDAARGLDTDTILLAGTNMPRRSSEAVLEATYQAVLGPGVTVQPDIQYVFRPSGGVPNPRDLNGARIKNAAVFGVRATVRY